MRCQSCVLAVFVAGVVSAGNSLAAEPHYSTDDIRLAISKSIPQLEKGSAGSADNRKCFTCHRQAAPILALVEAQRHGFEIDEHNLKRQLKHTADHLKRGQKNYLEGRGQGGSVITAGYALWALEAGGQESNETTTAVAGYLLQTQKNANHWSQTSRRPPTSGSDFTTTYLALRGLATFGTSEQQPKIDARKEVVSKWLLDTSPTETEDRVFRLRAMKYVVASKDVVRATAAKLIKSQRSNGGWSQTPDMESDTYATATVLVALLRGDEFTAETPVVRRGIQYLLDTQLDDGTWHVVTRAKGFQEYFESGFPHGKDQFISIAASSWATLALSLTLPES